MFLLLRCKDISFAGGLRSDDFIKSLTVQLVLCLNISLPLGKVMGCLDLPFLKVLDAVLHMVNELLYQSVDVVLEVSGDVVEVTFVGI